MYATLFVLAALASPTPAPQPAPTPTPPAPGPVQVDGRPWTVVTFASGNAQTISATQANVPKGTIFSASPGALCLGTVAVAGSQGSIPSGKSVTSTGPFTFTKIGNPAGCSFSIVSSVGGTTATVTFKQ